jgi:hypothetical protein
VEGMLRMPLMPSVKYGLHASDFHATQSLLKGIVLSFAVPNFIKIDQEMDTTGRNSVKHDCHFADFHEAPAYSAGFRKALLS